MLALLGQARFTTVNPMGTSRRYRRWIIIGAAICAGVFALLALMTWPRVFVSEERELTGSPMGVQELACFRHAGREGESAWVYRISDHAADAIAADRESLRRYPMWAALAFDGYKRVYWQTLNELQSGPDQILADWVFRETSTVVDVDHINSQADVRRLAVSLARQHDALICAWYVKEGDVVPKYFVYVLDLNQRILVKLSLLT